MRTEGGPKRKISNPPANAGTIIGESRGLLNPVFTSGVHFPGAPVREYRKSFSTFAARCPFNKAAGFLLSGRWHHYPVPAFDGRSRRTAGLYLPTGLHHCLQAAAERRSSTTPPNMEREARAANWRREWDSNPRWTRAHAGFQDRCLKPLGHPSGSRLALYARTGRFFQACPRF